MLRRMQKAMDATEHNDEIMFSAAVARHRCRFWGATSFSIFSTHLDAPLASAISIWSTNSRALVGRKLHLARSHECFGTAGVFLRVWKCARLPGWLCWLSACDVHAEWLRWGGAGVAAADGWAALKPRQVHLHRRFLQTCCAEPARCTVVRCTGNCYNAQSSRRLRETGGGEGSAHVVETALPLYQELFHRRAAMLPLITATTRLQCALAD